MAFCFAANGRPVTGARLTKRRRSTIIRAAPCGPFPAFGIVSESTSPCLSCGACCAHFRVSFYWAEAEQNRLPVELIEPVNPWLACLRGTWSNAPRCAALQGTIGRAVQCAVYEARPSTCRDVQPGDEHCNKARRRHGLPPLLPQTPAECSHDEIPVRLQTHDRSGNATIS